MEIYTMKDWENDRSLNVKIGQQIDNEVFDDLLGCVPPKYYAMGFFQVGEPYSHDWNTGKALYQTFERSDGGLYKYIGLKPAM